MANRFKAGDTVRQRPPKIIDPQDPERKRYIASAAPTIQGVVRDIRSEPNADPQITEPVYLARVDWDDNTPCDQWSREVSLIPSDHTPHKRLSAPPVAEHVADIGRTTGRQKAGAGVG